MTAAVTMLLVGYLPVVGQETAPTSDDQVALQALNLEQAEHLQQIQGWIAFGRDLGLTPRDLFAVGKTRNDKKALQEALRQEAAALSAALESSISAPEAARTAATRYIEARKRTLAEMDKLDDALIKQVGADSDPQKLAGLMIMGVVDNGVRLLCGIRNGVIGGAPTGSDAAAHMGTGSAPATP